MTGLLKAAGESSVSSVAQYDFRGGLAPGTPGGVDAGSGGGDMDDVLRRLGTLEKDVSVIKTDVAGIATVLPHLATKEDVAGIVAQLPNMATKAEVMEIKAEVAGIAAQLPNMATKAEVMEIKADVAGILAVLPHLATRADVAGIVTVLPNLATKAEVSDAMTSIIQWIVGTIIAVAALAFTIAKFVH